MRGPADFTELVLDACARLLAYSDLGIDVDEGRRARRDGGRATDPPSRSTSGGSGRRAAIPIRGRCRMRPCAARCTAPADGVVSRVGALAVGIAALELGAGRRTKADAIDHSVGVLCFAKRGDAVLAGDELAEVHARDEASAAAAVEAVLAAYTIADEAPPERGIVLDVVA